MKKSAVIAILSLFNTQIAFGFCKAEGLQRDIEVITSRGDLTIDERRKDIANAKSAFKEEMIECAVTGEAISDKAATLAISYLKADSTTIEGRDTDALIEKIKSRVPNN